MGSADVYAELPWDYFIRPLDVDSQGNVYAGIYFGIRTSSGRLYPFSLMK